MTSDTRGTGSDRSDGGQRPGSATSADHPNQPGSDEADRSKETTPAGVAGELEEKAEDLGASTDPETGTDDEQR